MSDLRRRTYLNELLDMNGELIFAGNLRSRVTGSNTIYSIPCYTPGKALIITGTGVFDNATKYSYSINDIIDCDHGLGYIYVPEINEGAMSFSRYKYTTNLEKNTIRIGTNVVQAAIGYSSYYYFNVCMYLVNMLEFSYTY